MNNEFEFLISAEQKGRRLDQFLSVVADLNLSRSQIKKLIEDGLISVNDQPTEPSYKIKSDDHIKVIIPPPKELTVRPESIPLDILFEDDDIIVVNKPSGMVTHPAPGNFSGTLVNALLHHCHLSNLGAPLRPGIVHRLDKDTSGVIVAAKTDAAYASLVKQIKARTVEKTYVALVHGVIKNNAGIIEARIGRHPVHRKKMAVIESPNSKLRTPNFSEAMVLGPSGEGGVYLIGLKYEGNINFKGVFTSGNESDNLLKIARRKKMPLLILEELTDVDVKSDLITLISNLSMMKYSSKYARIYLPKHTIRVIKRLGLGIDRKGDGTREKYLTIGKIYAD